MIESQAKFIFEMANEPLLICRLNDGKITMANKIAQAELAHGHPLKDLDQLLGRQQWQRLMTKTLDSSSKTESYANLKSSFGATPTRVRISPLVNSDENLALISFGKILPEDYGPYQSEQPSLVGTIAEVTSRLMHDVRNLIFPLVGHVEMALDSLDEQSSSYASLRGVQDACQDCEEKLSDIASVAPLGEPKSEFVHPSEVLKKTATILNYLLPKHTKIDVNVDETTPFVAISGKECQQKMTELLALAKARRGAMKEVSLNASDNSEGGVSLEIEFLEFAPIDNEALDIETEFLNALLPSVFGNTAFTWRQSASQNDLSFSLEIPASKTSPEQFPNQVSQAASEGHEVVLVYHQNDMMRDIIAGQLGAKGYVISTYSDPQTLIQDARNHSQDFGIFADCASSDQSSIDALCDLLEMDALRVILVACGETDVPQHARCARMPRNYRLDRVPELLRSAFDESK